MKLITFRYKCADCSNVFEAASLPGELYGEYLLRTESGGVGYLNALNDSEFLNIKAMLLNDSRLVSYTEREIAKVLHAIYGCVCDKAADGTTYMIGRFPACPECHSTKMLSSSEVNPLKTVDEDVPVITHQRWRSLNQDQKEEVVHKAVSDYLQKNEPLL